VRSPRLDRRPVTGRASRRPCRGPDRESLRLSGPCPDACRPGCLSPAAAEHRARAGAASQPGLHPPSPEIRRSPASGSPRSRRGRALRGRASRDPRARRSSSRASAAPRALRCPEPAQRPGRSGPPKRAARAARSVPPARAARPEPGPRRVRGSPVEEPERRPRAPAPPTPRASPLERERTESRARRERAAPGAQGRGARQAVPQRRAADPVGVAAERRVEPGPPCRAPVARGSPAPARAARRRWSAARTEAELRSRRRRFRPLWRQAAARRRRDAGGARASPTILRLARDPPRPVFE